MNNPAKSIISHIPDFLDYCQQINLSDKTQENYKRYLNKFILWLKKENKETLLPHDLTTNDIQAYKLYLSLSQDEKGRSLKKITQNYYLIALRALLSYFSARNILSLTPDKVKLPRNAKVNKITQFLARDQIELLLLLPNIKNNIGLRDKAILGTLISAGLKVNKLINLNRDDIEQLPGFTVPMIREYLDSRDDANKALFVNYRSRKGADRRLTARSVERIVNKYGRKSNLPYLVTPEILRWARVRDLLNEEIQINKIHSHNNFTIEDYKSDIGKINTKEVVNLNHYSPTWHNIEKAINEEINWLNKVISVLPEGYKDNPPFLKCDDCIFRKIAVLIVSGRIDAIQLLSKKGKGLWYNLTEQQGLKRLIRHGQEWHRKMIGLVCNYFEKENYKVDIEPILDYGRADIGAYSNSNNLYIEIGTVSLFKLWYNLSTMKNINFLIVPEENYVIEFKT